MDQSKDMLEGAPLIAPSSTDHPLYEAVVAACQSVYDPEIPVNIYELGLIYTIDINAESEVNIHPYHSPTIAPIPNLPAGRFLDLNLETYSSTVFY